MSKPNISVKQTIRSFWPFIRPNKLFFFLGTGFAGLGTLAGDIFPPLVISLAFNRIQALLASGQPMAFADFAPYLAVYAALMVSNVIIWRIQVVFVWIYELRGIKQIMEYLFNHLQHQDSKFHADRFGGSLVSQVNKYVGAFERIMDEFTWSVTTGITAFVASLIILAFNVPIYAVVLLGISILFMLLMAWRMRLQFPYDRKLAQSESVRTGKLADMIANVATVRAFAGETYENKLFEKQTSETHRTYIGLLKKHLINDLISHSGVALINIAAFTTGVLAITTFNAPAGTLFLAVSYTMALARRLWEFSRVLRNLNRGFGDASDMVEILSIQPGIKDAADATELQANRGDIQLENVDFYYPEQPDDKLFTKLSLHIKPGEKVGLVGHSGSGKTTLSRLLLRFMDIQKGQILIDNQDISQVSQASLRSAIAYVPQEPLMFHRTIAENINYGRPGATQKEIEIVARMAHADTFIKKLPKGYDTLVGERGVKLSGGQRQRIAIARAMIRNAPILILDEATSALDSESEVLIQDALWKLMEGRTAIVIAHRLSTIQKMDRIIVMDNGKIVEEGSHKELLARDGVYAGLWNHQSGGFIDE